MPKNILIDVFVINKHLKHKMSAIRKANQN